MIRLILLLIMLATFTNVSYASFPVLKETKPKVEVSQPNPFMDENRKILMLSLVPIPAALLGAIFFSAGSIGFVLGIIVGAIAVSSAVYSLYLNFKTPTFIWDWRNYLAILTALVLGALALFWTLIIIAFGGLG
ncbi:MAG: hypothetical protein P8L89_06725 [Polaribacter sp.]|nr:hypothetical protein [Polaribacter sp.]